MKKLYHKIPGVPLTVCTAEQKIAYNAAFYMSINSVARGRFKDQNGRPQAAEDFWRENAGTMSGVAAATFITTCIDDAMREIDANGINEKYNIDMIFCALRAGMKNYLSGFTVLSTYEAIGKTFPALYLDTENK